MNQPISPEAKAQHYIPKFYLKGFTDKRGSIWVYEKFKPLRESKPKKEAHRPDYYTHAEKGERDETAEDLLKMVESQVAPIIRKLANPHYKLDPVSAGHILLFVAFMFARVPNWRENLDRVAENIFKERQLKIARDKAAFYKHVESYEIASGKPLGRSYEELRQFVLSEKFEIKQESTAFNLGAMFQSALSIVKILQDFGYEGLYAPDGSFFMTSDSPVYTLLPDGRKEASIGAGFGWPGVEVFFPLNKRVCLRLKKGLNPRGRFIEGDYVDKINDLVMATATQYLYSSGRYRRISRLFDERGCKVRPGKESFLSWPSEPRRLF